MATNTTINPITNTTLAGAHELETKSLQLLYILTTIFFSLIIALGLAGNSLVLATLSVWPEMRTPCNLLIANICAADVGVCLLAAPLRIIEIYRGWLFGKALCYILTPIQDVLVCVSVITHTAIALERHRAIMSPFKTRITLRRVKLAVGVIWMVSYIAAGLPMVVFLKLYQAPNGLEYCYPVFSRIVYRLSYEIYLVVVFITAPIVIQCAAYFSIIRELRGKDEIQERCDSFNANASQKRTFRSRVRQKKHLIQMLVVLMLVFQACYLPRGVIMLIAEFSPETTNQLYFWYVDLVTMALYYLKHVLNPLILWVMSSEFRAGCLTIVRFTQLSSSNERPSSSPRNVIQGRKPMRNYNA